MLVIRLQRVGRKNHAEFRVVVTEHTNGPRSARYLEIVGNYNPHTNAAVLNKERITHWMSKGAKASGTVHNLLVTNKVISGTKVNVLPKKHAPVKEETSAAAA